MCSQRRIRGGLNVSINPVCSSLFCPHFLFQFGSVLAQPASSKSTHSIETMESLPKRLTETDVKLIFSCLTNSQQPPTKLRFKIIRVPQNGLKLSPPSFEFNGESFSRSSIGWRTSLCRTTYLNSCFLPMTYNI